MKHPTNDKRQIFSHIRQKWLAETPEERVRQSFVVTLHNEYGFALEQIQHIARGDSTGRITKRHLYAIVTLPNPDQARLLKKAITDHLTTTALEELVEANRRDKATARKNGSGVEKIRFNASAARITVTFRKKNVTDADIAAALDEARARAKIRARGHPGSPAISRCLSTGEDDSWGQSRTGHLTDCLQTRGSSE